MEVQPSPYPQGVGRAWPLSALLPGVCTALGPLTSPLLFVAGLLTKCKARRVAAWKLYVFVAISLIEFLVLISIIGVRSQVVSGLIPAAPAAGRGKKKRGARCLYPTLLLPLLCSCKPLDFFVLRALSTSMFLPPFVDRVRGEMFLLLRRGKEPNLEPG